MGTIVTCPSCSMQLRVPEELLGKSVRCPSCRGTFTGSGDPTPVALQSPAPATTPPLFSLSLDDDTLATPPPPDPGTPHSVTPLAPVPTASSESPAPRQDEMYPCPYCGERVWRESARCRYCGEDLAEESDRPWERSYRPMVRRDCEPHRANLVLVFGILSVVSMTCALLIIFGLPLGIVAWTMGQKDLQKMHAGLMDPAGLGSTQAGKICGIVGTILNGIYLLGCVVYVCAAVVVESFHW